jgi:adenylate kinase family enzyme
MLDLPVIHIDTHYWSHENGRRVQSTPEDWSKRHSKLISGDRWIIDGMKLGVLAERLAMADAVIYLDLPRGTCLWGIVRRRIHLRGRLHPQLETTTAYSPQFIGWILSFRRRQRPRILKLLTDFDGHLVLLRSRREVRRWLLATRTVDSRGFCL